MGNHKITYSIYNILTGYIKSPLTCSLFTVLKVTDLQETLVHWIFWPGIVELTNFDNMRAPYEIDAKITDFLHDGVIWNGITYKI